MTELPRTDSPGDLLRGTAELLDSLNDTLVTLREFTGQLREATNASKELETDS